MAHLLAEGFPARPLAYWQRSVAILSGREVPEGCPRYGYAIDSDGRMVGVLLLICSDTAAPGTEPAKRCNFSSWYVQPAYRGHAALLVAHVMKRQPGVTFTNISSERHTRPIIEAQGFQRYSDGVFLAAPLLSLSGHAARVRAFSPTDVEATGLSQAEHTILADHAGYGCDAVLATTAGRTTPLVFRRGRLKSVPVAQLVWCRGVADLAPCAGAVGRYLAARGLPLIAIDANAPVPGLPGHYFPGRTPKYFRGPDRPRSGDISYSELALFG